MPLAVVRLNGSEWAKPFELNDSMAMAPGMQLSKAELVTIEARLSFSGNAAPQPGDWFGLIDSVKPGVSGLNLTIDQVRK
jgi:cytochrome c-type biogenesis protein CcmH